MKRKVVLSIIFLFLCTLLFGCNKEENIDNQGSNDNNKSWPTNISYVPNITYDGSGKIVDTKEDTSWGNQYMIYIKGSTLDSANKYIDKLYENGYSVLNMYSDEGKYLKKPNKNNSYKMGYENSDGSINVMIILHDGKDEYDMVITFADMNS